MANYCRMMKNIPYIIQRTSLMKSFRVLGKSKGDRFLQASFSSTKAETEIPADGAVKFSSSEAGKWKARYTYYGSKYIDEVPAAQSHSIFLSLCAFMIYFCLLREENDLDDFLRANETDVPARLRKAVELATPDSKLKYRPETDEYHRWVREMDALKAKSKNS